MSPEKDSATGRSTSGAAWLMAGLVPVMFVVGLLAAYVLEGVVAPDGVGDQRSLISDLLGAAVTIALVLVPALAAWRIGKRAEARGSTSAPRLTAAVLAAIAVGAMVVQILVNAGSGRY